MRRIGIAAITLQLIGLLAFSLFLYHRFTLGVDFGIYNQAATEISRGNFNPSSSIVPYNVYPFLKSHFELIVWPLSLLLLVFRSSFVILAIQDLSLAGTGLIAFLWISKLIDSRNLAKRVAQAALVGTGLLILIDPLVYYTAALDFHMEATATFFAVFAAFDIWSGKSRRALVWLVLCLLCGDIGGLYVVGIGISATLASATTRRMGLILILAGVGWVGLIGSLGANLGSFVTTEYAYLAGRPVLSAGFGGAMAVIGGVLAHPSRPFDILRSRLHLIGTYLLPGGVIGMLTPWGFGVPVLVLLSSALQATPLFIGEPYQQFAVFPFVLFGTISLLTCLASDNSPVLVPFKLWSQHQLGRRLIAVIAVIGVLVGALYYADRKLPLTLKNNAVGGFIPGDEAEALRRVLAQTPADAEVIASLPISGRFSGRKYVYLYLSPTRAIPIKAKTVILVMDTAHTLQFVSPAQEESAARFAMQRFHATTIAIGTDLWVLEWSAPSVNSSVTLP